MDPYRSGGAAPNVVMRCLFCGGRCTGDVCGHCGGPTPGDGVRARDLTIDCPRCRERLEHTEFVGQDAGFVYCATCHGCLVPAWDWAVLLDRVPAFGVVPGDELTPRDDSPRGGLAPAVPCPVCSEPMKRQGFASIKELPIDVCIMHGIWFDASELAAALRAAERDDDVLIVRPPPQRAAAPAAPRPSPSRRSSRPPGPPPPLPPRPAPEPSASTPERGTIALLLDRLFDLLAPPR